MSRAGPGEREIRVAARIRLAWRNGQRLRRRERHRRDEVLRLPTLRPELDPDARPIGDVGLAVRVIVELPPQRAAGGQHLRLAVVEDVAVVAARVLGEHRGDDACAAVLLARERAHGAGRNRAGDPRNDRHAVGRLVLHGEHERVVHHLLIARHHLDPLDVAILGHAGRRFRLRIHVRPDGRHGDRRAGDDQVRLLAELPQVVGGEHARRRRILRIAFRRAGVDPARDRRRLRHRSATGSGEYSPMVRSMCHGGM